VALITQLGDCGVELLSQATPPTAGYQIIEIDAAGLGLGLGGSEDYLANDVSNEHDWRRASTRRT
jgi:hypothetical protein